MIVEHLPGVSVIIPTLDAGEAFVIGSLIDGHSNLLASLARSLCVLSALAKGNK
jgi:hypothetical protein